MSDICFFFGIYQEYELAKRLVDQLRKFYLDSEIICLADGSYDQDFAQLAISASVQYVQGTRLKLQQFGTAWIARNFQAILALSSAPNVIFLDPDSFILRPFAYLPESEVAGNLIPLPNGSLLLQGGCVFFKRSAIEKVIASQLLADPKYNHPSFGYLRYQLPYLQKNEQPDSAWLISEDLVNTDIINRLGLSIQEWSDVFCRLRELCPDPEFYAVLHPVKEININATYPGRKQLLELGARL